LQRVLSIREKAAVSNPRALMLALGNLGHTYDQQQRFGEAEPLFRRVLEIAIKVLGADNPAIWDSYVGAGLAWQEAGKYPESEQMLEKAVSLR
jgi:tetratricopeptide (TPR) repeat protein